MTLTRGENKQGGFTQMGEVAWWKHFSSLPSTHWPTTCDAHGLFGPKKSFFGALGSICTFSSLSCSMFSVNFQWQKYLKCVSVVRNHPQPRIWSNFDALRLETALMYSCDAFLDSGDESGESTCQHFWPDSGRRLYLSCRQCLGLPCFTPPVWAFTSPRASGPYLTTFVWGLCISFYWPDWVLNLIWFWAISKLFLHSQHM